MISSGRNNRPWLGEQVGDAQRIVPPHVSDCYLCPGNTRVSGATNPPYESIFVFDNDHPCVSPTAPAGKEKNWVKTSPGKAWFALFRAYGPLKPFFDRSWVLPDIEQVK